MHTLRGPAKPELTVLRSLANTASAVPDLPDALRRCDPGGLVRALDDQRLLALLGTRAIAIWGADAPRLLVEAVEADVAANRSRGLALEALSERFVDRLEEGGIAALVLKGPLQARRLHGDAGFRHSNDVDLLVSKGDLAPAAGVLTTFGYTVEPTPVRSHGLPDIHLILRNPAGGLPRIDLHWRIHWYEEGFSERLLTRSHKRGAFLEPEPRDDLAALMLFYARDGLYGLRGAVDIAAWRDLRSDLDHPLEEPWSEHPRLRRPWEAAALAAERVVGVPAGDLVPAHRRPARATRLAANLANWNQVGDPDQLRANVATVDALLSPPGELGHFLRRELFVTRAEIESIYRLPASARWRTRAMGVVHAAKVAVRLVAGLWSAFLPPRSRSAGE
ncbi:MAG: hypothetical protein QOI10_2562 [Solirubrobacterales bacterium]|jgi:hypothetical protein|nr:hypothetical protein [Solirubrobacterales bacterium]